MEQNSLACRKAHIGTGANEMIEEQIKQFEKV